LAPVEREARPLLGAVAHVSPCLAVYRPPLRPNPLAPLASALEISTPNLSNALRRRLRPHLTYANVTATLAFFIALSGAGAYAASQIAPKSVGAPKFRPGAVTANKLRTRHIRSPRAPYTPAPARTRSTPRPSATRAASGVVLFLLTHRKTLCG
jgi:hypothetical protein